MPTPQAPKTSLPPGAFVAIGLGSIAVVALILLSVYLPIATLLITPAPPAVEPVSAEAVRTREREFADRIASAADKIVKRSPFHPPIIAEPPEPIVPKNYGGPSIVGVAGGAVYFNESGGTTKRIPLGETIDGVKVIKIDAPWSVTLGWSGGEYVVAMLDRQPVSFDSTLTVKDLLFQTTPAADATAPGAPGRTPRN